MCVTWNGDFYLLLKLFERYKSTVIKEEHRNLALDPLKPETLSESGQRPADLPVKRRVQKGSGCVSALFLSPTF